MYIQKANIMKSLRKIENITGNDIIMSDTVSIEY